MKMRLTMSALGFLVMLVVLISMPVSRAEDWPQYRHDGNRSGVSGESIPFPLAPAWTYAPSQAPQPAWAEPAKEMNRLDFDYAPQPVVAEGRVYFGSSADDTLRCVSLASGEVLWRFTAGGPIRFAPAVDQGRVFLGCDDGYLYCLDAARGTLVWKFMAAPGDDQLLGNGRMISRWPLRSGVVVMNGRVDVVAGMWPDEGVHVYQLDEKNGKVLWRNDGSGALYVALPHPKSSGFSGVTPQGYLSANNDLLLVPTGRGVPAAFNHQNGDLAYYDPGLGGLKRNGGSWTLIHQDVYFNPLHDNATHVTTPEGDILPARPDGIGCYPLDKPAKAIFGLMPTTEVLVNRGRLYAAGGKQLFGYDFDALREKKAPAQAQLWAVAHPRAYALAMSGNALVVGSNGSVEAFDPATGKLLWKAAAPGQVRGLALSAGHIIASTADGKLYCFGAAGAAQAVKEPRQVLASPAEAEALAKQLLAKTARTEGYALVLGEKSLAVAQALVTNSKLHVVVPSADDAMVQARRTAAVDAGVYGTRLAVVQLATNDRLPFAPYFADLVIVAGPSQGMPVEEIYRCLRPCGGQLCFVSDNPAEARSLCEQIRLAASDSVKNEAHGVIVTRGALPGAGEWRSAKADPGNSGVGSESRVTLPMELLWFGGPGPQRMLDRHWGASSPLSVNGRVFMSGVNDLICADAYNGRELWDIPLPGAARWDCYKNGANMVADDTSIYIVVGSQGDVIRNVSETHPVVAYRIEQATGKTLATYKVPAQVAATVPGWGYIQVNKDLLIGSVANSMWMRATNDDSKEVFALSIKDGSLKWHYHPQGLVPDSSICLGNDRLYMLVVKNGGQSPPNQKVLIALDAQTGQELWHKDNPFGNRPVLVQAQGIVTLDGHSAYDGATGKELWRRNVSPMRIPIVQGDWIITQPDAYNLKTGEQRMVPDPLTGEDAPWKVTRAHGCGGLSGCANMVFFRSGVLGMLDDQTDALTSFGGLRPGCAVDVIAANGLLLLPETSSGCGCAYPYQTSIALAPAHDRKRQKWFVTSNSSSRAPVKSLNVLFGAPGDRHDSQGRSWLSYPRPALEGTMPIPVAVSAASASYYHGSRGEQLPKDGGQWLYENGLRGPGKVVVHLAPSDQLSATLVDHPIVIDGRIDADLHAPAEGALAMSVVAPRNAASAAALEDSDAGDAAPAAPVVPAAISASQAGGVAPANAKAQAAPARGKGKGKGKARSAAKPANQPASGNPTAALMLRCDAQALYVIVRSPAPRLLDGRRQWLASTRGEDAPIWNDDSWELFLTDKSRNAVVQLGVSASGARFDGLWRKGTAAVDASWNGPWKSAVTTSDREMVAEMAIPWSMLNQLGFDLHALRINGEGCTPSGWRYNIASQDALHAGPCNTFVTLLNPLDTAPEARKYTVRLHFAETDNVQPGQRLFDIKLQGRDLLKNFDICKEAGGSHKPLVKEFNGISPVEARLELEMRPGLVDGKLCGQPPILSALEVAEEQ